ncbi:class II histone deacetylase [Halomonas urumqiensis]|uniref:Class II histone deacetylase n=1 Tax=Halomonas urumqiensis TaxID=1684789 RepID=A0A2N7UQJ3_9GAMM|nr:class II histone deacetylase [Halomonas urumqiensis]PMR82713.1 class II histone deacetylase [Halomonas urumqiensis]PTB01968.1 class II histone deacetylase [Halomonas urumqiensis]GHE22081.1 class II histone deacetylase [Halomonas urumqiensis]
MSASQAPRDTGLFWHERCFWHDPGAIGVFSSRGEFLQPQPASESPESKRRLKNLLEVSGLIDELAVYKPAPASREDLERFHTPRYLDALEEGDRTRGGDGGDCAPYLPGSLLAARHSAGLAIAAVEAVARGELTNAYALCRPPGHHAEPDRGRGFCLLGNIPVAVMRARALGLVGRVAILDWDVHHGNGQQVAFEEDPEVLTVSLHQAGNYPLDTGFFEEQGTGAGQGVDLNLPLPPGCGLGAYDYAMTELVLPAIEAFAPELIVVACGYDACAKDPLGKMLLNSSAFARMTRELMEVAQRTCQGRLVMVHEGGYSEGYVPLCGHAVIQTLAGSALAVPDPQNDEIAAWAYQDLQPHQRQLIDGWREAWPGVAR